ncbi:MAG TPA: hypothetical protein VGB12_11080 [bacterium]
MARTAYGLRWTVAWGLEWEAKLCAKSTASRSTQAQRVLHEVSGQVCERSGAACRVAGGPPGLRWRSTPRRSSAGGR